MKPLVGISACLAGERVRYDEKNVHNLDLIRSLQEYFELVQVCPEVAIGLPVPREPIHLDEKGRVMNSAWTIDHGPALAEIAENLVEKYAGLCAFVFKSGSPSCGLESVAIKNNQFETLEKTGIGAFAKKLVESKKIVFTEDSSLIRQEDRQEFISRVLLMAQNKEP